MLKTVKKIGPVLALFTPERQEWRLTDIAEALGMPKSSAHALLTSLRNIDLLEVGASGRYQLSPRLLQLSRRMSDSVTIRHDALPAMERLATRLRETVTLCVVEYDQALTVATVAGSHPLVRVDGFAIGTPTPLFSSAVGWVLLSEMTPSAIVSQLRQAGGDGPTPELGEVEEVLLPTLQRVREAGHAVEDGDEVTEVACIAMPVRDRHKTIVAAVAVFTPRYRFARRREEILERLRETVETIDAAVASTAGA